MDRTAEFKAAVSSLVNRGHIQTRHQPNLSNHPARRGKEADAYSDFSRLASAIGKEIIETSSKLDKLTKRKCKCGLVHLECNHSFGTKHFFVTLLPVYCLLTKLRLSVQLCIVVKRKALFDDRPVEISVWRNYI
jgi:hypothetical protein